jgi:hypothetical protein
MRIHHLNCGTLCPHGARLINGEDGWLAPGRIVCHCLLIEVGDGLVLLDTGFGTEDTRNPRQLGAAGWLLHCGDAYFHHSEVATPPSCPPGA